MIDVKNVASEFSKYIEFDSNKKGIKVWATRVKLCLKTTTTMTK